MLYGIYESNNQKDTAELAYFCTQASQKVK